MANEHSALALCFGDAVSDVGTVQKYPLGTKREQLGQAYRYVKNVDATVTMVAGDLVYRDGTITNSMWQVNGDVSDVDGAYAVGIAQGVIANGGYGWVLTRGQASVKKLAGTAKQSWLKGDFLIAHNSSTADGKIARPVFAGTTIITPVELKKALERIVGWARGTTTKSAALGNAYIDLE